MRIFVFPIVIIGLFLVPTAIAGQSIKLENAWARESPPLVTTGAAYLKIISVSDQADRILGISGAVAKTIEIHTHLTENGMTKMRPVEALDVAATETTILEPGGLHVMLIGLKAPLKKGDVFPLTFKFEHAGEISVNVIIKSINETQ